MPLDPYVDVHIPMAITRQLRLRGVDVVAATVEGTHPHRTGSCWKPPPHRGAFSSPTTSAAEDASIGACVRDLELIARHGNPDEMHNTTIWLPL